MHIMDRTSKRQFENACEIILENGRERAGIGTLSEKTLHAVLKNYMEPDPAFHEIPTAGYVADIRRGSEIIEIQTGNFNVIRKKLACFLPLYQVTIVYPIPATKWLSWIDEKTGEVTSRRKSPKKGTPYMAFRELYKIKQFLTNDNLRIHLILLDVEEYRLLNGWSKDRKKGSVRHDRIPVDIVEELTIECREDYRMLLPPELTEEFLAKDYAVATKLPLGQAQTALNILNFLGVVQRVGKKGKAYLYQVPD